MSPSTADGMILTSENAKSNKLDGNIPHLAIRVRGNSMILELMACAHVGEKEGDGETAWHPLSLCRMFVNVV